MAYQAGITVDSTLRCSSIQKELQQWTSRAQAICETLGRGLASSLERGLAFLMQSMLALSRLSLCTSKCNDFCPQEEKMRNLVHPLLNI